MTYGEDGFYSVPSWLPKTATFHVLAQDRRSPDSAPSDVTVHGERCATWVQTHTGLAVDLEAPDPGSIHPADIRIALARAPRFAGHTIEMFSVAQHSVLVHQIVQAMWRGRGHALPADLALAALLHDAHEAYMGDISSPVASLPGLEAPLRQLKRRLQRAIHQRFGLPEALPEEWQKTIRHADLVALATEKRDLMAEPPRPWAALPPPTDYNLLDTGYRYWLAATFPMLLARLTKEVRP